MTVRAQKLIILLVLVPGVLVTGVTIVRRRSGRLRAKVQASRYPHQHLPSSEWEANAKLPPDPYALRDGETLANIARLRYGHQNYYHVIKVFNHIENEELVAGTTIQLPDVSDILSEEGFTKVAGAEVEMILCSRAKYDRVVNQLWNLRQNVPLRQPVVVPERLRQELLEAADDLQQATESLKAARPGVNRAPERMIRQLEQCMSVMRDLAEGANDGYGYDIDIVQQGYAFALTYAIIWARDGFK
jgi:hypothetical protein